MLASVSHKMLKILIELLFKFFMTTFVALFLFFRLDKFRLMLYWLIGLILCLSTSEKSFVCVLILRGT